MVGQPRKLCLSDHAENRWHERKHEQGDPREREAHTDRAFVAGAVSFLNEAR